MRWCSIHTHSSFSHGDGYRPPAEHVARADELGISAVAFTEHRNVSSHVQAEKAGAERGVKILFGCEFDVALPDEPLRRHFHQTVIAMNDEGYRNLNRLVTKAWKQTKYVPRLYIDDLMSSPAETKGLIVTSGCAHSYLACTLLGGKSLGEETTAEPSNEQLRAAAEIVERYQESYGDRYYLELQLFPELERSVMLNQIYADIAADTGVKTVATADVHYPYPDQNDIQEILHNTTRGPRKADDKDWEYGIRLTYPTSDDQVIERLMQCELTRSEAELALEGSVEIAERCNVSLPKTAPVQFAPDNVITDNLSASERLREWINDGIDWRIENTPRFADRFRIDEDHYLDRIRHEMTTIDEKEFWDYFLVVADLVVFAKNAGIGVGPGRGSAAGSLVCYLLRITEIDPMQFPLMQFERFIDPTRPDWPDIDIDFEDRRRKEVHRYAAERYGMDNVVGIMNFVRYRGKSAIDAIQKAYDLPQGPTVELKRLIVDRPSGDAREHNSIEDTVEDFADAAAIVEEHPDFLVATRLEGDNKSFNIHAGGLVISPVPVPDICAIYEKTEKGVTTRSIPYDKEDAEYLGMIKIDALGLANVGMISDVVHWTDVTWNQLYGLPYDLPEVLEGFSHSDMTGIFQFSGRTTLNLVNNILVKMAAEGRPATFKHLADINALSRPGALISGQTAKYVAVENGEEDPRIWGYEKVDEILAQSNGSLIYQEQVMAMGREVAGMPGGQVGALRRVIGKKKAGGAFDKFYEEFRDGAIATSGMTEADAKELWNYMATSSSYLFNIAHAISYSVIAYWAMWLKIHYPVEFYAGSLRRADAEDALALMQDAVRHGITVLPPDPLMSDISWKPFHGKLLAGFSQVHGVAGSLATKMIEWRDTEWKRIGQIPFSDYDTERTEITWNDMLSRPGKKGRKTLPDEPDRGIRGFGPVALKAFEEMSASADPFGIYTASDAVARVCQRIDSGEWPLPARTMVSSIIDDFADMQVIWIGLITEIRIIDVVAVEHKRHPTKTVEEIKSELGDRVTKAKVVCTDEDGVPVHVNISRYNYPDVAEDLAELRAGKDVLHVIGKASTEYGPAIQAENIIGITDDEEEECS